MIYPWLESTWQRCLQLYWQQRFPHAVLVTAPEGMGKSALVESLTALLLCQAPEQNRACGKCHSCHLFQQHCHPDYQQLGEVEKGASIDDIREINDFLNQTSYLKGAKIITLQADKLLPASSNALLKTLEEPADHVYFILVATKAKGLLPTLQSRCFKLNIAIPSESVAISWLKQAHSEHSLEDLKWFLTLAGGAPLRAQVLLQTPQIAQMIECFTAVFAYPFDAKPQQTILQWVSTEPQQALYLLYYWFAAFIRNMLTQENPKFNTLAARGVTPQKAFLFLQEINQALQAVPLPGINKPLLFEALFQRWHEIKAS
ncbi:MAG: hypothetical protein ACHQJ6_05355 [Candidatus Berkiellales bacterium]